jgi:hypothetical protein
VAQGARGGNPAYSAAHDGGAKAPSSPRFVFHVKIYRAFRPKRNRRKSLLRRFRTQGCYPRSDYRRKEAIEF